MHNKTEESDVSIELWILAAALAILFIVAMLVNAVLSTRAEAAAVTEKRAKDFAEYLMSTKARYETELAIQRDRERRQAMGLATPNPYIRNFSIGPEGYKDEAVDSYVNAPSTHAIKPQGLIILMQRYAKQLREQGYTVNCTIKAPVSHKL